MDINIAPIKPLTYASPRHHLALKLTSLSSLTFASLASLTAANERRTRLAGIARISVGVSLVGIIRANALRAATPAFSCGWREAERRCVREGALDGTDSVVR